MTLPLDPAWLAIAGTRISGAKLGATVLPGAVPAGSLPLLSLGGASMGTHWSLKTRADLARAPLLQLQLEAELARLVSELSNWDAGSDLSRYNRAPAGSWVSLPADCYRVCAYALQLAADSDGAFDPTLAPLVALWGFGPEGRRSEPPGAAERAAVAERIGWWRLRCDASRQALYQPGGVSLDLCGVGKGYAVDALAGVLDRAGIGDYLLEIGGEMRARGLRAPGQPWRVATELPLAADGGQAQAPVRILALTDRAVATSGDYWHGFVAGGRHYSHTLDPRSGEPVQAPPASVTVVHSEAMQADALATLLTVLAEPQAWALAERRQLPARWLYRHGDGYREVCTPAFLALCC